MSVIYRGTALSGTGLQCSHSGPLNVRNSSIPPFTCRLTPALLGCPVVNGTGYLFFFSDTVSAPPASVWAAVWANQVKTALLLVSNTYSSGPAAVVSAVNFWRLVGRSPKWDIHYTTKRSLYIYISSKLFSYHILSCKFNIFEFRCSKHFMKMWKMMNKYSCYHLILRRNIQS